VQIQRSESGYVRPEQRCERVTAPPYWNVIWQVDVHVQGSSARISKMTEGIACVREVGGFTENQLCPLLRCLIRDLVEGTIYRANGSKEPLVVVAVETKASKMAHHISVGRYGIDDVADFEVLWPLSPRPDSDKAQGLTHATSISSYS
jgi:hypothetical protein